MDFKSMPSIKAGNDNFHGSWQWIGLKRPIGIKTYLTMVKNEATIIGPPLNYQDI